MKNINEFLTTVNIEEIPSFEDLVEYSGSDNTLTKGSFIIGTDNKKFEGDWDPAWTEEYKLFERAYKYAGGKIKEEYSSQGVGEVFCKYEGNNDAAKYILLSFFRTIFGSLYRQDKIKHRK